MLSFLKINNSQNSETTLLFTDVGQSRTGGEFFFTSQICLFALFAKIKFSRNFQISSTW